MSDSGAGTFRRVVDAVYWTGAIVACVALVLVSAVIPGISAVIPSAMATGMSIGRAHQWALIT